MFPLSDSSVHASHGARPWVISVVAAMSLLAAVMLPSPAQAATSYNITSTSMDVVNGDGLCTFREALQSVVANATVNECISAGGPYTINLQNNATYSATTIGNVDAQWGNSAFHLFTSSQLTINGNGSTVTQSGQAQRIFIITGGNITMHNLTITGATATQAGTPFGEWGGGIMAVWPGTVVSLEDVTISGNRVGLEGAGIYVVAQAVANLNRVTLSNNEAAGGTGSAFQIRVDQAARMNIANSTMDGPARSLALTAVSTTVLASNITFRSSSGIATDAYSGTSLTLQNSILQGGCSQSGGTYTLTNVASNSATCSPAIVLPVLGALNDNGGPTQTMMPRLPNASKDAAPSCTYLSAGTNPLFANGAPITTDQRGFARDANCDLGAVEAMTISPASLPGGTFGVPYTAVISQTGGGTPVTFGVTAGALPAGLSIDAGSGVINGTPTAAGTSLFTITVTDSGGFTSDYRYSIAIARANQTITFNPQTTATRLFVAGGTFAIDPVATASSGLAPFYSSGSITVCTVAASSVTIISAGSCIIRANQGGNGNYFPATQVTQNVTISPGPQTLSFGAQAAQTFSSGGTFAINPLATSTSGLTPVYSSLTPAVCTLIGTTATIVTAGTCTLAANQAGNGNYTAAAQVTTDILIAKANQAITFSPQPGQTFSAGGSFAISPLATTTSGLVLTYSSLTAGVCTVSGTTVTIIAAGTCTLAANQAGDGNYNAAPQATQDVTISLASQVITFAALPAKTLGSLPFPVSATGGASGNAVTFTSQTPLVCTATGVNGSLITLLTAGTCTIRAAQLGNANYLAAVAAIQSFAVGSSFSNATLSSSANPGNFGSAITFFASINGVNPGGTVTFFNGIEPLCGAVPVNNGSAQCVVNNLAEGGHSITASYSGDLNNLGTQSPALIQIVPKIGQYQGAWWGGASENGWGLSLIEHGNQLVAGWYFYDQAGQPVWLIMPGCTWDAAFKVCTGNLQRSKARWYADYRAADLTTTVVGSATLRFTDADNGRLEYVVDGVSGSKTLLRLALGGNARAPFEFTDIWWGGISQNGWGVALYQANTALVGAWYTYDAQGNPTWMLFNGGTWINPTRFKANLTRSTGSSVLGGTYDATRLNTQTVGDLYFEFLDNNNAEMTYVVDGLVQFKMITKMKF